MKNENLKLAGKKCFLRYPKIDDFAEFTASSIVSRKFHRGLVNPPKDLETFQNYLKRNESEANENLFICQNTDSKIVGTANISQIFRLSFQNCYLGYYLFEKYTGKGLMTEAIELILRHAFKNLKLHRVEANVQPDNLSSIAVLKRCNFSKEGFSPKYLKISGKWRDHERWAITKENWRKL